MTAVLEKVQHRCTRCFRSLTADAADIGKEVPCEFCGQALVVPEVNLNSDEFGGAYSPGKFRGGEMKFGAPSDVTWVRNIDYANSDMLAPLWKRFVGAFLDGLLMGIALIVGLMIVSALISSGFIEERALRSKEWNIDRINAFAILYFPLGMLLLTQWNLIASRGQSLAKMLLGVRIVGRSGENPGFLRAVILRNWLRFALSFVPFFSLIDALVIFGDTRRCLHDYFGGTFVIENYGDVLENEAS